MKLFAGYAPPPPEPREVAGLRRLVAHHKAAKKRRGKARAKWWADVLLAEAEFDAWRATRDW
jgi:hypothetical protein